MTAVIVTTPDQLQAIIAEVGSLLEPASHRALGEGAGEVTQTGPANQRKPSIRAISGVLSWAP